MNGIRQYLESLSWRGKTVQKAGTGMKAGQVWDYPLKLEKGVDYRIKTQTCKNVKSMTCFLTRGWESVILHQETGPAPSFSYTPQTDGVYRLHLALDSTHNLAAPGGVGVTLLRERVPSRVNMFSWPMVQGVP